MKIGRNDPCPCGSGKKHKKCCYGKEQGATAAPEPLSRASREDAELHEALLRAMHRMRRRTLEKKPHIKEYYRARKLHNEIADAMIQYHDDGKFERIITPAPANQASRDPRVCHLESDFDLNTREGAQGFYDMLIYKPSPNMNCITEEFLQKHRYRKPEKIEFLQSMLASTLGLFEVTGADGDEGFVHLREVFTGAAHSIIDIGLSGDEHYGDYYLYTRIIQYRGTCFGTGLNLIFTKDDPFIQAHIRQHRKNYSPVGELMRFTQLYNQYTRDPDRIRVANTLA